MSTTSSAPAQSAPASMSASVDTTPPPRFDFPSWLPPMLVKELRQGLRQRGFVVGMIAAQVLLVIMYITGFAMEVREGSSRQLIDSMFWGTVFGALLLVAPLRALSALHAEIDARTMDLLLLTRLDSWRIVWGKWVSLMTQSLLIIVSLLPYGVVRYFFGSVDLVTDLMVIVMLIFLSGAATAVGLWASGMNRVVRMLVMIAAVMGAFNMLSGGAFRELQRELGMSGAGVTTIMFWGFTTFWAALCGCVTIYSLMLAVRWFAPAAENHAIGARLMPLLLAVPFGALAFASSRRMELMQVASVWLAGCGIIALIEMASVRELMAIHLRGRLGRPGLRGWLGALFLPGWPSAAAWAAVLLTAVVAVWTMIDLASVEDYKSAEVCWLAVLAWAGLVFPALITSILRSFSRISGAMYFILHALLGVFGVMAGGSAVSNSASAGTKFLDWLSHAIPPTSFWHGLHELNRSPDLPGVFFGQLLGVIVTVAMTLWLGRTHWLNVRLMRHAARQEAKNAGTGTDA